MMVHAIATKTFLVGVIAVLLAQHLFELYANGQPIKRKIIPRYVMEKEIRGPTFHVIHRIHLNTENRAYHKVLSRSHPLQKVSPKFRLVARQPASVAAEQVERHGGVHLQARHAFNFPKTRTTKDRDMNPKLSL